MLIQHNLILMVQETTTSLINLIHGERFALAVAAWLPVTTRTTT